MKLIVGLGNPGQKYKNNRHNVGFIVVEMYAISHGLSWRYSHEYVGYFSKSREFSLLKPSTYMNKSGESVKVVYDYFKLELKDIIVVHDDLDLAFGKVRLSFNSSSAGHNGVSSIIESLSSPEFTRLRVGIGHPTLASKGGASNEKVKDPIDYVLADFSKEESGRITPIVQKCIEAIDSYLADGVEATMNRFN